MGWVSKTFLIRPLVSRVSPAPPAPAPRRVEMYIYIYIYVYIYIYIYICILECCQSQRILRGAYRACLQARYEQTCFSLQQFTVPVQYPILYQIKIFIFFRTFRTALYFSLVHHRWRATCIYICFASSDDACYARNLRFNRERISLYGWDQKSEIRWGSH